MVADVDWYPLEKEKQSSIARDREFKSLKQVLEGKSRLLKQQGKGKSSNQWAMTRKKKPITTEEEKESYFSLYIINK